MTLKRPKKPSSEYITEDRDPRKRRKTKWKRDDSRLLSYALVAIIALGFVSGMSQMFLWKRDTYDRKIIRDVRLMRHLWQYQMSLDSVLLWRHEMDVNFLPMDTTRQRAFKNRDWGEMIMSAALRSK